MASNPEPGTASPASSNHQRTVACQRCHQKKMKCDLQPRCGNCVQSNVDCKDVPRTPRPRPTHAQIDALARELERTTDFLDRLALLQPDESHRAILSWSRNGKIPHLGHSAGPSSGGDSIVAHDHPGPNLSHIQPSTSTGPEHLQTDATLPHATARVPRANRSRSPEQRIPDEIANQQGEPLSDGFALDNVAYGGSTRAVFTRTVKSHARTSTLFGDITTPEPQPHPPLPSYSDSDLVDRAIAECEEQPDLEMEDLASGQLDYDGVPPDLAEHLLNLHWNRQQFDLLIVYRPLFIRDMAANGPYFSPLLLNAIFFSVSKFSSRLEVYDDPDDQKTAGMRFLRRARELMGQAFNESSIATIQAMLVLSSALSGLSGSAEWIYSGIAFRMIFDLDIHRERDAPAEESSLTPEELESERRIVWAAFVYDKFISLAGGRPTSWKEQDLQVPHRFLDHSEDSEVWTPFACGGPSDHPGSPARGISTFTALCSLSVILCPIISNVYRENQDPLPEPRLRSLSRSLDKWQANLPFEIRYDPTQRNQVVPPPHILSLHLLYHATVILLHHRWARVGADSARMSWTRCEAAARTLTALLSRYRETFSLSHAPYLISNTAYLAASIQVRMVAQKGKGSEAAVLLSTCLEALDDSIATNPVNSRLIRSIKTKMAKLGVTLPEKTASAHAKAADSSEEIGFDLECFAGIDWSQFPLALPDLTTVVPQDPL